MHADDAIRDAQHVRVRIRLFVVLAVRTLESARLDGPVVAHLGAVKIGQVLPDALINLLVVEDPVRAGRDEHRQAERERHEADHRRRFTPHPRPRYARHDTNADDHFREYAGVQPPGLQDSQFVAKGRGRRPRQPDDERREAANPGGGDRRPRRPGPSGRHVGPDHAGRSTRNGCVQFYLDDMPYTEVTPGDVNQFVNGGEVAAVEVYQPGTAPGRFMGTGDYSCTTVVLWTRYTAGN